LDFGDKIRKHDWIIKSTFIFGRIVRGISRDFYTISETIIPPERAFNRFLAVVDDNPPEPFFAWIHLYPPHYPYLPPEPYIGMFNSLPEMRSLNDQFKVFLSQNFSPNARPKINAIRTRYDEFIRYCDKQFEDFIDQLKTRNKLKNTVIILSSDHGESFEHGYLGHAGTLFEPETHIPLVIKSASQTEGQVINEPVEQIDIPATILDLANVRVPSWMEGRSLLPLINGESLPSRPSFIMNFQGNPSRGHQITEGTVAVRSNDYKLIHYLKQSKSLLFDLKNDPNELNNLFDKKPELGRRLLSLIQDNLDKANEKILKGE
jgi:arylsulfatase A-like enzyme